MPSAETARPTCACGRPLPPGSERCDRCTAERRQRIIGEANVGWSPADPLDDWHWSWLVTGAGVVAFLALLLLLDALVIAAIVLALCIALAIGLEL